MTGDASVGTQRGIARGSTEYVQPIAVLKSGSHWATVKAVAAASALAPHDDALSQPQ